MVSRLDRLWPLTDLIPTDFRPIRSRFAPGFRPISIVPHKTSVLTPSMDPLELTLGRPGATFGPK